MIGVWSAIWWLIEHWWLIAYIGAVAAGYIIGGWRLALAIGSLGIGHRIYQLGRSHGRAEIERRDQARRDHLQEHYDEIAGRPLDPDSAYERLLDRARDQ